MKKSNLFTGILFMLGGALCLVIALMLDTKLDSLLFGFSGGLIVPGVIMIAKYFYWTHPKIETDILNGWKMRGSNWAMSVKKD